MAENFTWTPWNSHAFLLCVNISVCLDDVHSEKPTFHVSRETSMRHLLPVHPPVGVEAAGGKDRPR